MTTAPTRRSLLRAAINKLQAADIPSPQWEARFLLCDCEGITPTDIATHPEAPVRNTAQYQDWIDKRAAGIPMSRITGMRSFWGLDFEVSAETLDPRVDSERLVELALPLIPKDHPYHIVDVGTGTGCLLLSLLHECPMAEGVGLDISTGALETARRNADRLDLSKRVVFWESNWLSAVEDRSVDLLISNPPYIVHSEIDGLDAAVRDHDPILALDGGPDGLDAYRAIIDAAPKVLRPDGWIALEIGWDQGRSVPNLLDMAGFLRISCHQDTGGRDRVVLGQIPGSAPPKKTLGKGLATG